MSFNAMYCSANNCGQVLTSMNLIDSIQFGIADCKGIFSHQLLTFFKRRLFSTKQTALFLETSYSVLSSNDSILYLPFKIKLRNDVFGAATHDSTLLIKIEFRGRAATQLLQMKVNQKKIWPIKLIKRSHLFIF